MCISKKIRSLLHVFCFSIIVHIQGVISLAFIITNVLIFVKMLLTKSIFIRNYN
jgi:hypothetical protein